MSNRNILTISFKHKDSKEEITFRNIEFISFYEGFYTIFRDIKGSKMICKINSNSYFISYVGETDFSLNF